MTMKTNYNFYLEAFKSPVLKRYRIYALERRKVREKLKLQLKRIEKRPLQQNKIVIGVIGGFKYWCNRCVNIFWSKLSPKDAICTKCGSSKIMSL